MCYDSLSLYTLPVPWGRFTIGFWLPLIIIAWGQLLIDGCKNGDIADYFVHSPLLSITMHSLVITIVSIIIIFDVSLCQIWLMGARWG